MNDLTKAICIYIYSRPARGAVSKAFKAAGVRIGQGQAIGYDSQGRDGQDAAYRGQISQADALLLEAELKKIPATILGIDAYCDWFKG